MRCNLKIGRAVSQKIARTPRQRFFTEGNEGGGEKRNNFYSKAAKAAEI
jgi:hypothetical protein